MELKVADYVRRMDREGELVASLLRLPEDARFRFIIELTRHHPYFGTRLALRCLQKRSYIDQIFKDGLQVADAGSIKYWVEPLLPRIGFRRMLAILRERVETDPRSVGRALYFLGPSASSQREALRQEFDALYELTKNNGGILGPNVVPHPQEPSRVLFSPVEGPRWSES